MSPLVLSSRDLEQVARMSEAIDVVSDAFRALARGDAQMPPKIYVEVSEHSGDFRAMPAYNRTLNAAGLKWVTSYAKNIQLPSVIGIYVLSRASDGCPLAIMDGTFLTNLRTGAAVGAATRALARKESTVFGFIGGGRQARYALKALREVFPIKEVRLFDPNASSSRAFGEAADKDGPPIVTCKSPGDCTRTADVITTTTPSRAPVVWMPDIKPGTHINAMGADAKGKQELDPHILKAAKIIIDDWGQTPHSGEVNVALSQGRISQSDLRATIGEVLRGVKPGREKPEDITVFDSTGLAVQDLAVAKHLYDRCLQKGLGKPIEIFQDA
ncbi:MAG: ornithine cyclodeaminase family protein [Nitrospirae bacterium]|nr:ornithine cyclodeaminase family protein [Nitrospirota bacterium]